MKMHLFSALVAVIIAAPAHAAVQAADATAQPQSPRQTRPEVRSSDPRVLPETLRVYWNLHHTGDGLYYRRIYN